MRPPTSIHLASASADEICLMIRSASEYLRPEYMQHAFTWNVPQALDDQALPVPDSDEEGCFTRTLGAYCIGYGVDARNIVFSVNWDCEDAPRFELHPINTPGRKKYTVLELLAVMRALRYNERFATVSFAGVNLDGLQGLRDNYFQTADKLTTRSGEEIFLEQEGIFVLTEEIRAIAIKSKRLRRLDFTSCLTRTPVTTDNCRDTGCEIPEALFPLCRRQLTNVDWIVLNGIKLGESDMDYLVDAASQKICHLRALEVANCGLSMLDIDLLLSTMQAHEDTLECINISGNLGRLNLESFQTRLVGFPFMRKLSLSRLQRTSGPEPLLSPETLLEWKLEELNLGQTTLNEATVDAISTYLAHPISDTLRTLRLDQCGLSGRDVAIIMRSMCNRSDEPRNLHLHVNENRLQNDHSLLFDAIKNNKTPMFLSMRMVEYQKEDHFRRLVNALRVNTTLRSLDISKASLPYDAGLDTCEALQRMFAENTTLEELDISGEHAHLEVAKFGIGLNHALTGLKENRSLRKLTMEYQNLGLQGANTLAEVLEENTTIREIYCENNDMNLQCFTVLINGLQRNKTVLHIPDMDADRAEALKRIRSEVASINSSTVTMPNKSSMRRTLTAAVTSKSARPTTNPNPAHAVYSDQDVEATIRSLTEKWNDEVQRKHQYLIRNFNLFHDLPIDMPVEYQHERPLSSMSAGAILADAHDDTTPKIEKEVQLGENFEKQIRLGEEFDEKVRLEEWGMRNGRSDYLAGGKEFNV